MESMRKSNISNRLLQSHYDIQFAQLVQSLYPILYWAVFFNEFWYHTVFKFILDSAI